MLDQVAAEWSGLVDLSGQAAREAWFQIRELAAVNSPWAAVRGGKLCPVWIDQLLLEEI